MSDSTHTLNIIGRVSHFFASHGPLSVLILMTAVLFGFIAFVVTPKQYNPEIVRPAFALSMSYQGATQEEAIDRVVYELLEKIVTVPGVEDVYTTVTDEARIQTTVIFEVGYDTTQAKVDLLAQIQQHRYLARGFISEPNVIEINPETIPVLQVAFSSPTLAGNELRRKVQRLAQSITGISSVSGVEVLGSYDPAVIVFLNPSKMGEYGITQEMILRTVQQSQVRFVGQGFSGAARSVSFVFDGRADSVSDIAQLQITPELQLRDIASVFMGAASSRSYVFYSEKEQETAEVVMLSVAKVEGSSAPEVTRAARSKIDTLLQTDEFADIQYSVVSDDGVVANQEVMGLTKNLITSVVIVVMVLLLFLSFRASAVVFVAIPLTLLIVFGIGYLFDQTINRITLFALILSLGLLVDSAIVVVENIYTHLRRVSAETFAATRQLVVAGAVNEIGVGILLSTVTSVIVFLPMRYITGMMGPYMGPIAFFVPVALLVSLLVAIVVTPFVATYVLKVSETKNPLSQFVDRGMRRITRYYRRLLTYILYNSRVQKYLLLGALGMFILSLLLPLTGLVHFQMLPRADRDQFYLYIDAPVNTSIPKTRAIAQEVTLLLMDDPDVRSVQQFVAQAPIVDFNGMFKGAQNRNQPSQATLRVNLTPNGFRSRSSTDVVTDLRKRVWEVYPDYAPMLRFMEEPPGPPVKATFVAKVSAESVQGARQLAYEVFNMLPKVQGVVDRYIEEDAPVERVVYTLNQARARAYGVSAQEVKTALQLINGPLTATEYISSDAGEFTPVLLEFSQENVDAPSDIAYLSVSAQNGEKIPLLSLLDVSYEQRPSFVSFDGNTPVVYVTGEAQGHPIVYVVLESMSKLLRGNLSDYTVTNWNLFSMNLENAEGEEFTIQWGGEWEMTLENFRDLGIAMGVALLLVYAVLVAQYNSFSKPAYILVTVPLGLIGILWGFFFMETFFGVTLTATALIGFIALIGLVVNNAIIYLEYVQQREGAGVALREALIEAGSARLRPIFLTSLTTILGSLTIAGDPVWSGLAWAIVFGLSLSTILTLVIYPTLLVYFYPNKT